MIRIVIPLEPAPWQAPLAQRGKKRVSPKRYSQFRAAGRRYVAYSRPRLDPDGTLLPLTCPVYVDVEIVLARKPGDQSEYPTRHDYGDYDNFRKAAIDLLNETVLEDDRLVLGPCGTAGLYGKRFCGNNEAPHLKICIVLPGEEPKVSPRLWFPETLRTEHKEIDT
jgi:Holliday junction resolvase RusA-like endonuclease